MIARFFLLCTVLCCWTSQAQEEEHFRFSIYFPGGRYYITPYQAEKLRYTIDSLYEKGHYEISIHSHTDNIGGVAYNEWLSQMRSLTTRLELVETNGLNVSDIVIKDFGQHNPVYSNETPEGRMRNRRVDIIFWPLSL